MWEVDEPMSTPTLVRRISSSTSRLRPVLLKKIRPPSSLIGYSQIQCHPEAESRGISCGTIVPTEILRFAQDDMYAVSYFVEAAAGGMYHPGSMRLGTSFFFSVASYSARMYGSSIQ